MEVCRRYLLTSSSKRDSVWLKKLIDAEPVPAWQYLPGTILAASVLFVSARLKPQYQLKNPCLHYHTFENKKQYLFNMLNMSIASEFLDSRLRGNDEVDAGMMKCMQE